MTSDTPGPGAPDGAPAPIPAPGPEPAGAAAGGQWPAELVPPETQPTPPDLTAAPAFPPAAVPEPAPPMPTGAPLPVAQPPAAEPTWGQPGPQQPAAAAPPVAQPPAGGTWGAPPPVGQTPPPQPPPGGAWGAPAQQPGGWAPGPGSPGGPPAGWAPEPARSGNGCLKACLIVGGILVALFIVLSIAVAVLGMRFAQDMGINSDGTRQSCDLISDDQLAAIIGGQPTAMPLGGIVDATIGQVLDKRVLADAPDCWLLDGPGSSTTGRLAKQDSSDATAVFASAKAAAQAGGYLAYETTGSDGPGDEAFCTGVSPALSVGVLVRSGGSLAYVSLIDGSSSAGTDLQSTADGVTTSPTICDLAGQVAQEMLR
jgi:hypothetical protein